ncbi:NAD(P)-binding domain-containing protein [Brevundimonas sp. Root1423]|uniref:NAD(P)-binding domain-containing protein n=1 Tax=Brevundimonas sp. Root1423 TaxID=1736462 RepID=UPI00351614FF
MRKIRERRTSSIRRSGAGPASSCCDSESRAERKSARRRWRQGRGRANAPENHSGDHAMTLRIAFIGLGNMGGGMAANQAKAGNAVSAFDLSQDALDRAAAAGCTPVGSVAEAVRDADVVITMLPAGPHVLKVYSEQVIGAAPTSALLLDCSTIDVDTARKVAGLGKDAGYAFADAPVSGGTMAADAGTLAFMVGCDEPDFARIEAALEPMSRATFRAGDHGAGQAAKICNNMILLVRPSTWIRRARWRGWPRRRATPSPTRRCLAGRWRRTPGRWPSWSAATSRTSPASRRRWSR